MKTQFNRRKKLFILSIVLVTCSVRAQSYFGFATENYSGVNGVILNPASIADSRFLVDINLAGVHGLGTNNVFSANKLSDLFKDDFDADIDLNQNLDTENRLYTLGDVLGPSVMVTLNSKNAIAVYTRARFISNASFNGTDIDQIEDLDNIDFNDPNFNLIIDQSNTLANAHAWGEVGISYARVFKDDNQHFLKAGITAKYLIGLGSGYGNTTDLRGTYVGNNNGASDFYGGNIDLEGNLAYGLSYDGDFDDFDFDTLERPTSFGVDLGAVYEWRPDFEDYWVTDKNGNKILDPTQNKYKLRIGISITDIGGINYKDGFQSNYLINGESIDFVNDLQEVVLNPASDIDDVTTILENNQDFINQVAENSSFGDLINDLQNANTVAEVENLLDANSEELVDLIEEIENTDNLEELLNDFNLINSLTTQGLKTSLPTALHINADWSFNKNLFINLATDLSLTSRKKTGRVSIANEIALIPRYESRSFSFYSPFRIQQGTGFEWGTGFRFGPLYVGSGSILSNLIGGNIEGADVYAGLKIPILRKRDKDFDDDGVKDKKDECVEVPGEIENNGCPWPDTDGDTVIDKEDECPEEAGEPENKGCPWPDTDGDSVLDKDDQCPEEAGEPENNGCPWPDTDGDSVLDKDDQCPDEPGTVANNGCPEPEVTEEVQKELNSYAKSILFNSGKSTIKAESAAVLADILKILNEYPNASFTIEGHTDSIGSAPSNQKLSEKRAAAVERFLVDKGVDPSRLSSIGYGEEKPIATNMYKDGREKNRRVEINLVKE